MILSCSLCQGQGTFNQEGCREKCFLVLSLYVRRVDMLNHHQG